ncbi:MAG: CYTH domain-containing protein [Prevotella sp.]|nr:CYTH domain-containing protein [Prevotella sp.]
MSGIEIERKFLVHKAGKLYKTVAFARSHICQGYICDGKRPTVRVRIRDDKGFITIKGKSDKKGLSRYEFEKEISLEEARQLMKLCMPELIEKTRYLVRSGAHVFEIDEFYGSNAGLVMAEVELRYEDEPYEKPEFIGEEVTGDKRFNNSSLRKNPFIVWCDTLPQEYR